LDKSSDYRPKQLIDKKHQARFYNRVFLQSGKAASNPGGYLPLCELVAANLMQ
jgi:hypothetical protein